MTALQVWTVECEGDGCDDVHVGVHGQSLGKVRDDAAGHGWSTADGDLCRTCVEPRERIDSALRAQLPGQVTIHDVLTDVTHDIEVPA